MTVSGKNEGVTSSAHGASTALRALSASYDRRSDVMYLAVADAPAVAMHDELGLVLRHDPATKEPIGVTIIDFAAHWWGDRRSHRLNIVDRIASYLKLPRQVVYETLRDNSDGPRGQSASEQSSNCEAVTNNSEPSP
jgi:hypothetical protein